jgi:hypothetical protein
MDENRTCDRAYANQQRKQNRELLIFRHRSTIAELTGKLIILLIPILGLLYPMTQFLPRLYDWAMRSKVLRMYGELRFLEDEITHALSTGGDTSEMTVRLDRLVEQAKHIKIPVAYASMLYSLRDHIDLVREKIRRQGS